LDASPESCGQRYRQNIDSSFHIFTDTLADEHNQGRGGRALPILPALGGSSRDG
jgi:hypothetical protein